MGKFTRRFLLMPSFLRMFVIRLKLELLPVLVRRARGRSRLAPMLLKYIKRRESCCCFLEIITGELFTFLSNVLSPSLMFPILPCVFRAIDNKCDFHLPPTNARACVGWSRIVL